jgi:hypothetical protein
MTFGAIYAIVIGVAMIGQWCFSLLQNKVPELETEPIRIRFHIFAEFITAITLIVAGVGLLLDSGWSLQVFPVSIGMLLYTVMASPGYFAQRDEWRMVGLFAVILVLAVVSLVLVL